MLPTLLTTTLMLCISLGSFTKVLKAMESLGTGKRFARLSKSTSCTNMTVFAATEDYATVIWEEVDYTTYGGETESIKITITGVVGKQLSSHQVEIPDFPVTFLNAYLMDMGDGVGVNDCYPKGYGTHEEMKILNDLSNNYVLEKAITLKCTKTLNCCSRYTVKRFNRIQ